MESKALQQIKDQQFLPEKVSEDTVRDFLFGTDIASKLTDEQQNLFVTICKAQNLNPLKREVHAVPYKSKQKNPDGSDRYELTIITGYEVYLKRAEVIGVLDGWEVEFSGKLVEVEVEKQVWNNYKKPKAGYEKQMVKVKRCDPENPFTCTLIIWRKDRSRPFKHSVDFDEYTQDNSMWNSKPRTMLKKVVIAQGFRLCFPLEFSGMPYISEEVYENEAQEQNTEVKSDDGKENPFMPNQASKKEEKKKEEVIDAEVVEAPDNIKELQSKFKAKAKEKGLKPSVFLKVAEKELNKTHEEFSEADWNSVLTKLEEI